jgi:hypothetical protein
VFLQIDQEMGQKSEKQRETTGIGRRPSRNKERGRFGVNCKDFKPVETVSILHSESPIVSLWCNSEHESALGELLQMKLPRKKSLPR